MRVFSNFTDAWSEVARDLKEMGLDTGDNACQSELIDYGYMVTEPALAEIGSTKMLGGYDDFLNFAIAERLDTDKQVYNTIRELRQNSASRRLHISLWDPDKSTGGPQRPSRTLGYSFVERGGRLHITHLMRSCQFGPCFKDDVKVAYWLLQHICGQAQKVPGRYTHFINSLYVYKEDLEGVF